MSQTRSKFLSSVEVIPVAKYDCNAFNLVDASAIALSAASLSEEVDPQIYC
ncbi:MAG: hypothetical protein WCG98_02900 [bacterium]